MKSVSHPCSFSSLLSGMDVGAQFLLPDGARTGDDRVEGRDTSRGHRGTCPPSAPACPLTIE